MNRFSVFFFLILNIQIVCAQAPTDQILFSKIIENCLFENSRPFSVKNKLIVFDKKFKTLKKDLRAKYGEGIFNDENRLIVPRDLVISNCRIEEDLDFSDMSFLRSLNIYFSDMHDLILNGSYSKVTITNNNVQILRIIYSSINDELTIKKNSLENLKFLNNTFKTNVNISDNRVSTDIKLIKNSFNATSGFSCILKSDSLFFGRPFNHNIQVDIHNDTDIPVEINENTFLANDSLQRINIRGHISDLIFDNNIVESTLDLNGLAIDNRLVITDNHFSSYISFNDLIFPEVFNLVRWGQVDRFKIIVLKRIKSTYAEVWGELVECYPRIMAIEDKEEKFVIPYFGWNNVELGDENAYEKLIFSYKSLYNIYTNRGDLEAANASYAEMKEIQRRRLKYIYKHEGGFKNYFRWQLNILLKFYTNHGTDPALAMVISVYVILIFGFIYFFYPSEWDLASKSKLINDYRDFVEKNEKGYFKPFLILTKGLFFSLLNAITLSLNSFITLGFGNIPTQGLARYACVIEGFIGWFLLSIFTVAMINQVLA